MSIIELIRCDMHRHLIPGNKLTRFLKRLSIPGCKYMVLWRLRERFGGGLLLRFYSRIYGYQIPKGTRIGPGFYIGHFGPIIINKNAVIGANCNISPNVTIGMENRGPRKGCPTISDLVWIGTGAVIVGNIHIGNDVLIAPNAFVNVDVPDHSIVVGNPCIIKHRDDATKDYIII